MSGFHNSIHVRLAAVPATDAFGIDVKIDGAAVLGTVLADAPGVLRWLDAPLAADRVIEAGWIIGFLQRGPLRLPVTMPCAGWVLAAAPDGVRVEYGTPLFRYLRASEAVLP